MDTQKIINELIKIGGFYNEELEIIKENNTPFIVLKSIEFYNIFYLSNSDQYYCNDETLNSLKQCDKLIETKKGSYFCFA